LFILLCGFVHSRWEIGLVWPILIMRQIYPEFVRRVGQAIASAIAVAAEVRENCRLYSGGLDSDIRGQTCNN
jgi:hypothetical protein